MNLDYYIKNIITSFLGLCILAAIVKFAIFDPTEQQYENIGTIIGVIVIFLGIMGIGYINTKSAPENKVKQHLFLHLALVIFLFLTDLIFGQSDFIVDILRNMSCFIALELGAYFYFRTNRQKLLLN
ncbi:MAG: hypothetical protein LKF82_12395 [Acinetobacter populi]|jgi:predicted membrane channel-forming protein YqfA (hemolysin III family)|uniref:hypothetical protein n=1 Tax=Acinetobacter populi TaxID=1582270 RepID=UPI002352B73E|nr:hypothetical protein [Acinetobacter populi]MCH4248606.1 hypothetical protein [Acinetobacter populi]